MPKVYYVNWFRRTPDGGFAWPGFGENSRVVKWIFDRLDGKAGGEETFLGTVPTKEDLDLASTSGSRSSATSCPLRFANSATLWRRLWRTKTPQLIPKV